MLTYHLDPASRTPLYEQLYLAIRRDIMDGMLAAGERLPSKRRFAEHLKVGQITVEAAYGQLVAEGYVISRPRAGYFAAAIERAPRAAQQTAANPDASDPDSFDQTASKDAPEIVRDFRTNIVDTARFPFSTWARETRSVLTDYADTLLTAAPPQGALPLREQIRQYLYAFRGLTVDVDQIVVGAGSEYLLTLLTLLLGRDRLYSLENPGYPKLDQIFRGAGASVVPIPLDRQGLRLDALRRSGASVVYLTPSHHFPLGVVMPVGRRMALLRWAAETDDRYLIEDDYDSEFRYASRPIPAMKQLDHADRVIYLNTFAKSLAPSLRIAYMVLPRRLLAEYREKFGFYSSTVPSFEQYTLARFLADGGFERHVARSRNLYKSRRDALLAALRNGPLGPRLTITGAEAGLHILVQVAGSRDEAALIADAACEGVRVYGLSGYYAVGTRGIPPATVILGYSGMDADALRDGAARLARAWAEP